GSSDAREPRLAEHGLNGRLRCWASALPRSFRGEDGHLRVHLVAPARRALDACLGSLRDRERYFEVLLARLAEVLISWHGALLLTRSSQCYSARGRSRGSTLHRGHPSGPNGCRSEKIR